VSLAGAVREALLRAGIPEGEHRSGHDWRGNATEALSAASPGFFGRVLSEYPTKRRADGLSTLHLATRRRKQ
jgi:hypothetical protein